MQIAYSTSRRNVPLSTRRGGAYFTQRWLESEDSVPVIGAQLFNAALSVYNIPY
jgi:hypothetical protein